MKKFIALGGVALLLSGTAVMAQGSPETGSVDATVAEAGLPVVEATEGTDIPAAEAELKAEASVDADTTASTEAASTEVAAAPSTDADASTSFTDVQIEAYVMAAIEVQEMQADTTLDDAAQQAHASTILAEAGLDAPTFNAISDAVQSDPAVAERVQLALASRRGSSGA